MNEVGWEAVGRAARPNLHREAEDHSMWLSVRFLDWPRSVPTRLDAACEHQWSRTTQFLFAASLCQDPTCARCPYHVTRPRRKRYSQFSMFFIFEPALSSGRLCSLPGPRALLLAIGRNRPSTTRKHGPDHRWTLDLLRPNPHNAFQRRGTGHRQRLAPPHTRASSPASTHERSTIRPQSHREQNDTFKGEEQAKHKTIDTSTPLFHPAAADSTRCAWVTPKTRADKKAKPRRSWAQVQNQASTTQPGKITAGELID